MAMVIIGGMVFYNDDVETIGVLVLGSRVPSSEWNAHGSSTLHESNTKMLLRPTIKSTLKCDQ